MTLIGQPAPQFKEQAVVDGGDIKEISLEDFKGKWAIILFYTADFSNLCPTELTQFRDKLSTFKELGAEVLGVSVDSARAHKRWLKDDLGDLGFPLISDIKKTLARDYGVLLQEHGIATRGTFIIDPEQNIQYVGIHSPKVGRDVNEVIRVLSALSTGELCGGGWQPGDEHIKPS